MIIRTYECDFCRTIYKIDDDNLFGIYWVKNNRFEVSLNKRDVEHHICRNCIDSVLECFGRAANNDKN